MSMNLILYFEDSDGIIIRREDLWQTPTTVTDAILDTKDPFIAYQKWVEKVAPDKATASAHIREIQNIIDLMKKYKPVWGVI